jgi:hypothetical protein
VTAVVAAALVLAGCGAAASEGGTPGAASPAPSVAGAAPLPTSLDQARAAWKAAGVQDYRLQLEMTCFCPRTTVTSTVEGGKVTASDVQGADGAPGGPSSGDARLPRTVEELFAIVARQDPARVEVTYGAQGVPLSITADPMPQAADDEFGYAVVFSRPAGGTVPKTDGSWTRAELPPGVSWPTDDPGVTGARAVIVGKGAGAKLYLGLWGSSSCPAVPLTLRDAGVRRQGAETVASVRVDVDGTSTEQACTADFGPTVYVSTPPANAGGGTGPAVQLLTTTATGDRDAPGVTESVVPVAAD